MIDVDFKMEDRKGNTFVMKETRCVKKLMKNYNLNVKKPSNYDSVKTSLLHFTVSGKNFLEYEIAKLLERYMKA